MKQINNGAVGSNGKSRGATGKKKSSLLAQFYQKSMIAAASAASGGGVGGEETSSDDEDFVYESHDDDDNDDDDGSSSGSADDDDNDDDADENSSDESDESDQHKGRKNGDRKNDVDAKNIATASTEKRGATKGVPLLLMLDNEDEDDEEDEDYIDPQDASSGESDESSDSDESDEASSKSDESDESVDNATLCTVPQVAKRGRPSKKTTMTIKTAKEKSKSQPVNERSSKNKNKSNGNSNNKATTVMSNDQQQLPAGSTLCAATTAKMAKQYNICCICLDESHDSHDEIVSCDACGFMAHEGCYGICDSESKMSTDSSASTEPWFCNSCLFESTTELKRLSSFSAVSSSSSASASASASASSPAAHLSCFRRQCELCPNVECGLMKETDTGRFVHMVCALYTPDVTFQDTDKLWPVVLDEIPATRWGEQICSLCDDMRYSRTGMVISCDAGLCKVYFHVTCAQKHGYLVDPNHIEDSNEPFLAYCKLHNEKAHIAARKRNYHAMMGNYSSNHLTDKLLFETSVDKERLVRKFALAQQHYAASKQKIARVLQQRKVSRMITTCPSALRMLLAKSSLLDGGTAGSSHQTSGGMTRRNGDADHQKNMACVTFTVDFVNYYFEREKKMPQCYRERSDLREQQTQLTRQEAALRADYEQKQADYRALADQHQKNATLLSKCVQLIEMSCCSSNEAKKSSEKKTNELRDKLERVKQLCKLPSSLGDTNASATALNTATANIAANTAHLLGGKQKINHREGNTTSSSSSSGIRNNTSNNNNNINNNTLSVHLRHLSPSVVRAATDRMATAATTDAPVVCSSSSQSASTSLSATKRKRTGSKLSYLAPHTLDLNASCAVCAQKMNAHLLVHCDTCHLYYHIGCLDPPLTCVPKKTKLYGWECSQCVHKKGSDYEEEEKEEDALASTSGPRSTRRERKPKVFASPQSDELRRTPYKKKKGGAVGKTTVGAKKTPMSQKKKKKNKETGMEKNTEEDKQNDKEKSKPQAIAKPTNTNDPAVTPKSPRTPRAPRASRSPQKTPKSSELVLDSLTSSSSSSGNNSSGNPVRNASARTQPPSGTTAITHSNTDADAIFIDDDGSSTQHSSSPNKSLSPISRPLSRQNAAAPVAAAVCSATNGNKSAQAAPRQLLAALLHSESSHSCIMLSSTENSPVKVRQQLLPSSWQPPPPPLQTAVHPAATAAVRKQLSKSTSDETNQVANQRSTAAKAASLKRTHSGRIAAEAAGSQRSLVAGSSSLSFSDADSAAEDTENSDRSRTVSVASSPATLVVGRTRKATRAANNNK